MPTFAAMADNVYALLQQAWSVARTSEAAVFGVEVAIVTNVQDPEKQGRVKICFPRLPGKPESGWARIAFAAAGAGRGFYWVPEVNDEVLVAFERGQQNRPYVIGALWNGKDKPMKDAYTDDNTTRMIQTRSGHQIVLDDKGGEEKIRIADKSGKRALTFDVKEKKLLVEAKEGDVRIEAEKKLVLRCEDLEVKTRKSGKFEIGTTFELKVEQRAQWKAGPQLNLRASKVQLNPPSLTLQGLADAAQEAASTAPAKALPPPPQRGWIELEVVGDDGRPLEGASVSVTHDEEQVAFATVPKSGKVRIENLVMRDQYLVRVNGEEIEVASGPGAGSEPFPPLPQRHDK